MRYFKFGDLNFSELITFEDREYRKMEFGNIVMDAISIDASDDAIAEWLMRTNAVEITKEEYDSLFLPLAETVIVNQPNEAQ